MRFCQKRSRPPQKKKKKKRSIGNVGGPGKNFLKINFCKKGPLHLENRGAATACRAYGLEINFKKTKVVIMGIKEKNGVQRCIMLGSMPMEQVTRFKCLGSWITEDAGCEVDIGARIEMAKAAFLQNKELMRRNIRFKTKLKILNCYVFCSNKLWM